MPYVQFSARARLDLLEIGDYTVDRWGEDQALRYVAKIESRCQSLAERPDLGRPYEGSLPGMRRLEQGRHVIFYRKSADGIRILRVLHGKMLPENYLADEDEELPGELG